MSFLGSPFAAFLTHDWGKDELGRDNHHRVVQVAKNLKQRGLPIWVDEHQLTDNVFHQICQGVDSSDITIVFVTAKYVAAVVAAEASACQSGFNYAVARMGTALMIPVLMEQRMTDSALWPEPLAVLLQANPVRMWDDADLSGYGLEHLVDRILRLCPARKSQVLPRYSPREDTSDQTVGKV
jgi:hypothetical protein